jgi:hypothetical protein
MILIDNIIIISKYLINKICPLKSNIKYIKYEDLNDNDYNNMLITFYNIQNLFYLKIIRAKGRV